MSKEIKELLSWIKSPARAVARMFRTSHTTIRRVWDSTTTQCIGGQYV